MSNLGHNPSLLITNNGYNETISTTPLVLVCFSGPDFYFTKFWKLFIQVIWHHMLQRRKVADLVLQKVVFGCPRQG